MSRYRSEFLPRIIQQLLPGILFALLCNISLATALNTEIQLEADPATPPRATLVTYAPGQLYYERFGHNAIWLQNPARGVNHVISFGFFDFNQPSFLSRFLRGDTLYFAAAYDPQTEFSQYQRQGRSISLQKLNLNPLQYARLEDYLIGQVQPDKRNYRYEYFRNNCSTRVRDAIDLVLNRKLYQNLSSKVVASTLRTQIHQAAGPDAWLYLGMDLAMGPSLDKPQSLWQASFIPAVFSRAIKTMPALVEPEIVYFQAARSSEIAAPLVYLFSYGLAIALGMFLLAALFSWRRNYLIAAVFLSLLSLGGIFLLWLWLATSHIDAAGNWNVLLLNPLYLPATLWFAGNSEGSNKLAKWVLASSLIALLGAWYSGQNTLAALSFLSPLLGLVVYLLFKVEKLPDNSSVPLTLHR